MPDSLHIAEFLEPAQLAIISHDEPYHDGQFGKGVSIYDEEFPDVNEADIVLVGCGDQRGAAPFKNNSGPDAIRRELFSMYNWQPELRIADIGNVTTGAEISDTHAALKTILKELSGIKKPVVIMGGSHDLTLAQYYSIAEGDELIEVACVDAKIDIDLNSPSPADHFLMEMLTGEPNFVRHYNHIGFQSYYVHPGMLETMDKLRFDCFRVGRVRENMDDMEPVIRHADFLSFDISAIANAYAPANLLSPNGFTGDEACAIMRFAGMSNVNRSLGIYGYDPDADVNNITAKQISQMIWYYLEGRARGLREPGIEQREAFNEYHIAFAEVATTFLQSKRTGRWWMQLPDNKYIACTYNDYLQASSNEIPERWLRAQERSA